MTSVTDRFCGGLALLAGSFLLIGGLVLTRPLLDPDPTLPADPGPQILAIAAHYRGGLLLLLLFALVGIGVIAGVPTLAVRMRLLGPVLLDQSARWSFAAGLLWVLRALFLATVRGPWALRYAGLLEPQNRKQEILLLWPLMRQVDWFFQWGGALCLGAAFLCGGLVYSRWVGRLRLVGVAQLLAAAAVAASLLYVLPFHYPRRFAAPGFPRAGVYASAVLLYETTALAMLATGTLLWFGAPGTEAPVED